ncbi:hypothetical protein KOI35_24945 [Actinoplanes bogorensis]|uniref:Uncharacterized protein n=1 Tax=Paractinoplanes bogorensis TaxID=1610840 RepID=A0ABS5YTH6_9ACTN|nr:hypothetical protein [Actinoplanes bogorensis]MBU2666762.1 hypothetical protein [Actinoplanes bogorensis]
MRRAWLLPALLTAIALGALPAVSAAQADVAPATTRIDAVDRAAQGERVVVQLTATCPAGATMQLDVTVTAANETRIAQGNRVKRIDCTGAAQTAELRAEHNPVGALFIVGPATARTVRTVCDASACAVTALDESIRIS